MKKNIKDCLPYYLGCPCQYRHKVYPFSQEWRSGLVDLDSIESTRNGSIDVMPIIRLLSDITEDEVKECYHKNYIWHNIPPSCIDKIEVERGENYPVNQVRIHFKNKPINGTGYMCGMNIMYLNQLSPVQFHYLLSKHFDLFDLIADGLAIDAAKQNVNQQ